MYYLVLLGPGLKAKLSNYPFQVGMLIALPTDTTAKRNLPIPQQSASLLFSSSTYLALFLLTNGLQSRTRRFYRHNGHFKVLSLLP